MQAITLQTREGGFVVKVLIPPFQIAAEGILWGSRAFFVTEDPNVYREGLLFAVPPGMEVKDDA